jgi:hypothetical protein
MAEETPRWQSVHALMPKAVAVGVHGTLQCRMTTCRTIAFLLADDRWTNNNQPAMGVSELDADRQQPAQVGSRGVCNNNDKEKEDRGTWSMSWIILGSIWGVSQAHVGGGGGEEGRCAQNGNETGGKCWVCWPIKKYILLKLYFPYDSGQHPQLAHGCFALLLLEAAPYRLAHGFACNLRFQKSSQYHGLWLLDTNLVWMTRTTDSTFFWCGVLFFTSWEALCRIVLKWIRKKWWWKDAPSRAALWVVRSLDAH